MPQPPEPAAAAIRARMRASAARCATCPPERVCAWDCEQGLSIPDIMNGVTLLLEGKLNRAEPAPVPADRAIWQRYNGE